jgi:hypothetical protein
LVVSAFAKMNFLKLPFTQPLVRLTTFFDVNTFEPVVTIPVVKDKVSLKTVFPVNVNPSVLFKSTLCKVTPLIEVVVVLPPMVNLALFKGPGA